MSSSRPNGVGTADSDQYHDDAADATILLPASLPLEQKAVQQLLAFAAVHSPAGERVACAACATPEFHPGAVAPVGSSLRHRAMPSRGAAH